MGEAEVVVLRDAAAVAVAAAERFAITLTTAVRERGQAVVALSGGSTPQAMFELLASPPYQQQLPWADIHVLWADERLVPPEAPGSNYGQARSILLQQVPIPAGNLHRMRGELPAELAAADYTSQLAALSESIDQAAGRAWPRIDLALLGLGSDGHTASLFPGSPVWEAAPVVVAQADYEGRPAQRLTLTPLVLNDAREVVFLVTGQSKAEAVASTLHGPFDPGQWPAQRIQLADGALIWLLDEAAAAGLS